jgi:pimeloyl-ACP methyl ester carboxylesterase
MLIHDYGEKDAPTIIMLHGGGLSWWSLLPAAEKLADDYHLLLPVIDGHGEAGSLTFTTIEDYAQKLISYINAKLQGKVLAIYGLSLGGQIACEILSQQGDIADYAIFDGTLVIAQPAALWLKPLYHLGYSWSKNRRFAAAQARALSLPAEMFEQYYLDSQKISKASLLNILHSNNTYAPGENLFRTTAKSLIIHGSREAAAIRKSAALLHSLLPHSSLVIAAGCKHGELALNQPQILAVKIKDLLNQ